MLTNPFTGQTISFLATDDEVLVMESSYQPGGAPAPAHLHPAQEERFTVLSGALVAEVGGFERTLRAGDELVIPAGVPHVFGGHADEPGTVRWEVRPPLRTREFFEGLFGLLEATAAAQAGGTEPRVSFDVTAYGDVFELA